MKKKANGFISLVAVAFLLLAAAWLGGLILRYQETDLLFQRYQDRRDLQESFEKTLKGLLETTQASYEPAKEPWPQFAAGLQLPSGVQGEYIDHSARLNLNWLRTDFLQNTPLKSLFLNGNAAIFQEARFKNGPYSSLKPLEDFFDPKVLAQYFTWISLPNINTTDEFMVEKVAGLRAGSDSVGATTRSRLRQILVEQKVLTTQNELESFLGTDAPTLGELFTVIPELNVNTADPYLIEALVTYPGWKLVQAQAKAQQIIQQRQSGPLTAEQLRNILGVEKNHRLLQYLGVESTVFEARFSSDKGRYHGIFLLLPPETGDKRQIKLLQQGWTS